MGVVGCDTGAIGDQPGNPNDYDPANPPEPPFPDNPFPDDGTCGHMNMIVSGVTPTVQLLIDQSGSMEQGFGGTDRWNAVYQSLMGSSGVVTQLQSDVEFGLSLYTSFDGNAGGQCPVITDVDPAVDNFAAMDAMFGPARPQQDTPTGESIDAVAAKLKQHPGIGSKVIILGTDGEPDTCAQPNPQNGQQEALDAARRAFSDGIRTFVISVGDEVGADHLQDMANAGVGKGNNPMIDAPYYVANNPDQLVEAFNTIIGGVKGCVFTINGEVDPAKGVQGMVAIDGDELDYGTEWRMIDGKTFEVLGQACETIEDGDLHHISAVFPCGVVVIE